MEPIITIVLINGKKLTGTNNDFVMLSSFREINVILNVIENRVVINSNQVAYIRAAEDYEIEHYKLMGLKGV